MAVFGALAKKGKEPSAPRKIGIGMFIAALGFVIMAVGSCYNCPFSDVDGNCALAEQIPVSWDINDDEPWRALE